MDIAEEKQSVRAAVFKAAASTPDSQLETQSDAAIARLLASPHYSSATTIFSYASKGRHEVRTRRLLEKMLADGKRLCVPYVDSNEVHASLLTNVDDLVPRSYGVPEPRVDKIQKINPLEIELAIVPGVAFDAECNRVGYGNGYFDRFLLLTTAVKAGLAYDFQLFTSVPYNESDVPLDALYSAVREFAPQKRA
ncbi:5-formyltetrahydrofolate cyclo-ligase [Candidatus Micrarchaeota archaeon CG1_02_55_22]|nr:MAG: 5-formyltetrahydrofolate cyclo-ligase [Candidatus Micrarchaeota archaeon CG1_02_55_22]